MRGLLPSPLRNGTGVCMFPHSALRGWKEFPVLPVEMLMFRILLAAASPALALTRVTTLWDPGQADVQDGRWTLI